MNGRIGVFVAVALGLLLAAVAGQYLSRVDDVPSPTIISVKPSGAAALAELLRREGYTVRSDASPRPRLAPDEVGVVFEGFGSVVGSADARHSLRASVREGAGMVMLPLPESFQAAVKQAENHPFSAWRRTGDGERQMAANAASYYELDDPNIQLYYTEEWGVVGMTKLGKGTVVAFGDGTVATNRLLDKADNAAIVLDAIRVAGAKKKIVFPEAAFSGEKPGLLATLGPWAQALVYQGLFLIVVAIATLGKRYGLEDVATNAVRSSRDIANGIADTLRRRRMGGVALGILLEDAERIKGEKPSVDMRRLLSDPKLDESTAFEAARRLVEGEDDRASSAVRPRGNGSR